MKLLHIVSSFFMLSAVCAVEPVESLLGRAGPVIPKEVIRKIGQDVRQVNQRRMASFSSILANFPDGILVLERLSRYVAEAETNGSTISSTAFFPPNQVQIQAENGTKYLASFERCFKATVHNFNATVFHESCDWKGPTLTIVKPAGGTFAFVGYNGNSWHSIDGGSYYNEKSFLSDVYVPPGGQIAQMYKYVTTNRSRVARNTTMGPGFFGYWHQEYETDLDVSLDFSPRVRLHASGERMNAEIEEYEVVLVRMLSQ